ncbi:MarR family winged helix-turn-helix transcriptional regulator [Bythopirellula goksoeyrii]|uniref:HTH-type transcriptional regulator MgrA n=1 Tax=Bythopirellula goksoeyrii TaxID=1400387 RepID=A0A5B9QEG0_9BACT|nr:MarR family transcriptional regulator [Bythopirellula goksoeyrii]QEG37427.1 HTH-type transcriptional regulator MgrA [Bythopirellula goksoeyrii]
MPSGKQLKRPRRSASTATVDDVLADAILRAIRRILRRTAEHSQHVFNESGLTVPQLLCLRLIGQAPANGELTAVQLAEIIQLSPATISRILDRLESQELIVRNRSQEDRRRVSLKLTRSGRKNLDKLPTPLQEEFLQRLQELPEKKRTALLNSLEQIVEMMGAGEMDAAPVLATGVHVKPER